MDFGLAAKKQNSLIAPDEPEVFDLRQGSSPVLFLFQHSGHIVPKSLIDDQGRPLGLPAEWFDERNPGARHEALDIGTRALTDELAVHNPESSIIRANYSRLVVDLNRKSDSTTLIPPCSSEDCSIPIPGNLNLSNEAKEQRIREFYAPFHQAVQDEIQRLRNIHGHVIVLDMHSFTGEWQKRRRPFEVGTLYFEGSPLADAVNRSLLRSVRQGFQTHYPYIIYDKEDNGAREFTERNGLPYIGIEIRQDILASPMGLQRMTGIISDMKSDVLRELTPVPQGSAPVLAASGS